MTTFNHRNIPHPVLRPGGQDYRPEFEFRGNVANVRKDEENHCIVVAVQYQLTEPILLELVQQSRAQFTTMLDCPEGRSRESHSTQQEQQEITLDSRRYNGAVNVQSFITATQDIPKLHSPSWNAEITHLLAQGTPLPEAAILAISHPGQFRTGDAEPLESCLVITPSDHIQEGRFDISLEDQLIAIRVNTRDKARIERARNEQRGTYLWPSMYLAAIEQALRQHLLEEHQDKQWTQTIREQLERAEIDTNDQETFMARTLTYAQQLLEDPMKRLIEDEAT